MTNSVEICKQLSSLNFINVKQIFKWKLLECAICMGINANCMSVMVLKYTMTFNVKTCEIKKKYVYELMFVKWNSSFIIIIIMEFFMLFFGGQIYTWSGFLHARVVFRIVVERVDILMSTAANLTVQVARLPDSHPCH